MLTDANPGLVSLRLPLYPAVQVSVSFSAEAGTLSTSAIQPLIRLAPGATPSAATVLRMGVVGRQPAILRENRYSFSAAAAGTRAIQCVRRKSGKDEERQL